MNKLVEEFKRLISKDRVNFIIHCLKLGLILLFILGLLMPFAVGGLITNGQISMAGVQGAVLYILPLLVIMFAYAFFVLNKNAKLSNLLFKVATIICTLTVFWGLLLFFVGLQADGSDLGTGMMFMIIFNAFMWYLFFAEKKVNVLVIKYAKPTSQDEEQVIEASKEE